MSSGFVSMQLVDAIRPFTIIVLLTVGIAGIRLEGMMSKPNQKNESQFSELSGEDMAQLDKQRALVAAAAKQKYGTPSLTKTKSDLVVLQRLVDDQVFNKTQTYELQCLGVAFGDVLASEFPLRWVMVTDEYGTDPTLRYKKMLLQINALTMISKRIERNEHVNLRQLLEITGQQLARFEKDSPK
jgi:Domain of unknown function (DUF3806)